MKIILLEQVKKLGVVGDVVEVKNGYARNFLIPSEKALRATKANIDLFEIRKGEIQQKNKDKVAIAEDVASKIDGKYVIVLQQAGEDDRLYGSVTSTEIAKSLNNKEVSKTSINLHNPIKYIGIYDVEVDVFAGISSKIKVNVATSKEAAKEAEKQDKNASRKPADKKSAKKVKEVAEEEDSEESAA